MAGGPESIQAILRGRRRAGFVGRGGQLAVFRENFGRPPGERAYIFNVYGEGGVGKSTLLEQWRQITRSVRPMRRRPTSAGRGSSTPSFPGGWSTGRSSSTTDG